MSLLSHKKRGHTAEMLSVKSGIVRQELVEEAQKIYDLCQDPSVPKEQKDVARGELDRMIVKLEGKVETTRLEKDAHGKR